MADFTFNVAKGRIVELANRVNNNDPTNSAFIVVPIAAGGVSDATLIDLDDLDAILATAANECTGTGWNRKTVTTLTVTVTDGSDKVEVDMADQVWTAVDGAATTATDLIVCYDPDTTAGTGTTLVPLVQLDFAAIPNGGDITAQINASGIFRAS